MKKILYVLLIALISLTIAYLVTDFFDRKPNISTQTQRPSDDRIKELRTLPYINWAPLKESEENIKGVIKHNAELSYEGVNLYCSRGSSGAQIMDMNGQILHQFTDKRQLNKRGQGRTWHMIEPYLDNCFLVIIESKMILLIDWDSNIIWKKNIAAHHDLAVTENGDIYALTAGPEQDNTIRPSETITDNKIAILSREGEIKREISLAKIIAKNKRLLSLARNKKQIFQRHMYNKQAINIFHANTVEIINRDVMINSQKIFRNGDVLFCLRNLNTIGVLDIKKEEILWDWGPGQLDCPHSPSLLDNGNILVFDNGTFRRYSRVIEVNPLSGKIEWEYRGTPVEAFFSRTMGFAQRLPNGNTLISEGEKGHVFEVTPDGTTVWEFYNPELKMRSKREKRYERGTLYRMIRYPARRPRS